ncbi:1-deoxy-D-xylulose-5-phosphate synthase, partial [bacterium (Candidatus Howlettbacteria) CG_4_10_14_0_8_um_filter_40_9]
MGMKILKSIEKPSDIKKLKSNELDQLCEEIREEIISVVSKRGGHLAPSLGVVELTLGVHLALDCPNDKIVWDVGHQCYTHKIITGRKDDFPTLRSYRGISGFPRREESEYDVANVGHASTSISTALGLAKARDLRGEDRTIVAVVGDGSLSGGLAYEGLNQAGHLKTNLIVVLNDNEMSIDKNVGALSVHLNRIRNDEGLNKVKNDLRSKMSKIPTVGTLINNLGESAEEALKNLLVPGKFFEELGFRYVGPIDGHNILEVERNIRFAKKIGGPVLVHVRTKKGKGYVPAEENPGRFHGTPPFDLDAEKIEAASKVAAIPVKAPSYME